MNLADAITSRLKRIVETTNPIHSHDVFHYADAEASDKPSWSTLLRVLQTLMDEDDEYAGFASRVETLENLMGCRRLMCKLKQEATKDGTTIMKALRCLKSCSAIQAQEVQDWVRERR